MTAFLAASRLGRITLHLGCWLWHGLARGTALRAHTAFHLAGIRREFLRR